MGSRGSASVPASVQEAVPAWVRVGVCARWLWDLGLRTSAWVHVGSRVNARLCKPMRDLARHGSVSGPVWVARLCSFSRWVAGHLPLDKSGARWLRIASLNVRRGVLAARFG